MTGKDTVVDAPGRCQNCKSAKRKEKVRWICRKNCVERNNIDTCMMKPAQYELTPQDKDALSDYPDWVPPKVPPPGCPCNQYTSCKECIEAQTHKRTVFEDVVDVHEHDAQTRQDERERIIEKLNKRKVSLNTFFNIILCMENHFAGGNMTDKPNCSTCDHKDNDWCDVLNRILAWHETSLISEVGCFFHSQAREYLMRDVIAELKRLENPDDPYDGYAHAIALIRDGVVKHE